MAHTRRRAAEYRIAIHTVGDVGARLRKTTIIAGPQQNCNLRRMSPICWDGELITQKATAYMPPYLPGRLSRVRVLEAQGELFAKEAR